jgi:hypothetical protein
VPCKYVKLPDGSFAIVCSRDKRHKCAYCNDDAPLLCDFKVGEGKTCDKPICKVCSVSVAHGIDHCRIHAIRGDKEYDQKAP